MLHAPYRTQALSLFLLPNNDYISRSVQQRHDHELRQLIYLPYTVMVAEGRLPSIDHRHDWLRVSWGFRMYVPRDLMLTSRVFGSLFTLICRCASEFRFRMAVHGHSGQILESNMPEISGVKVWQPATVLLIGRDHGQSVEIEIQIWSTGGLAGRS